jgi:hypothetical protein
MNNVFPIGALYMTAYIHMFIYSLLLNRVVKILSVIFQTLGTRNLCVEVLYIFCQLFEG